MIEFFSVLLNFRRDVFGNSVYHRTETTRALTPNQKLQILKTYANIKVISSDPSLTDKKFERFIHNEFVSKNPLYSLCFVCQDLASVRHHVIQLQHGGLTVPKNLVPLCNYCHAEIHPWLKEERTYPKPNIDWDQAICLLIRKQGDKTFHDWLMSVKNPRTRIGKFAITVSSDLNFPTQTRHLFLFLDYYRDNPELRQQVKSAHSAWRKFRKNINPNPNELHT